MRHKHIPITMLQFADDTIYVCKVEIQNIVVIKSMLRYFELASRLKVNFHKIRLGSIGVQHRMVGRFTTIFNYSIT